ncbi:response regulator transcription factor [Mesorhizobium sp. ORS 3428]|uniref:response regulator transcription factor n=1 Tax=Mesorhizobium sp. ORS 3428 TaxID=540997 RepID=UPI0008D9CF1E|nr:response regulator transcription factor [Mesorhizobium sp. ORS 3428]OHV89330.1 DNA-binding response regulator [Mesorhizobium sp. ORS 3428]
MSPARRVRLLLADDHTLVRAGLRALLEQLPDVEVIAEAETGRAALAQVKKLRPQIVLMDISMPDLNGLEATARIAKEVPHTRVIILSVHASEEYVLQALRAGAWGYMLKSAAVSELALAIESVAGGKNYLGPGISGKIITDYLGRAGEQKTVLEALTSRQREVLQLIAEGKNTKEIAYTLDVSVKTVESHRSHVMERLGIFDVPGLVRYAVRVGLVSLS